MGVPIGDAQKRSKMDLPWSAEPFTRCESVFGSKVNIWCLQRMEDRKLFVKGIPFNKSSEDEGAAIQSRMSKT